MRALAVAMISSPRSGFISSETEFDAEKIKQLRAIVDDVVPGDGKVDDLIEATSAAVIELSWGRSDSASAKAAETQLADLAASARALAVNWSAVASNSAPRGAVREALIGLAGSRQFSSRVQWFDNLTDVFDNDLWKIADKLDRLIADLKSGRRITHTPEYLCAAKIAHAWHQATGKLPAVTRNTEAASGPQATPFQRFLAAAVPAPAISDSVVRNVVDAMRKRTA